MTGVWVGEGRRAHISQRRQNFPLSHRTLYRPFWSMSSCHWTVGISESITMTSQITSLKVVYSNVYSDADQRKHQSSASLAFPTQRASYAENVSIWWRHHDAIFWLPPILLCRRQILHVWWLYLAGPQLWRDKTPQCQTWWMFYLLFLRDC